VPYVVECYYGPSPTLNLQKESINILLLSWKNDLRTKTECHFASPSAVLSRRLEQRSRVIEGFKFG
jgi:hypothetical protein